MGYFVQDNGDGTYSLVDTGNTQDTSQWNVLGTGAQSAMEQSLNQRAGQPNAPAGSPLGLGGLLPQLNMAPYMLEQIRSTEAIAIAQQEYLRERMKQLEIPEMQANTELQKHTLALNLAVSRANALGYWIEPDIGAQAVSPVRNYLNTGNAQVTAEDMASIRKQLAGAGWPGGDDQAAIRDFLKTIAPGSQSDLVARLQGNPMPSAKSFEPKDIVNVRKQLTAAGWPGGSDTEAVNTFLGMVQPGQEDLVARLTAGIKPQLSPNLGGSPLPVGGAPVPPGGVPTIAGANLLANPKPFSDVLSMLGTQPQVAQNLSALAQGVGRTPTIELQNLMGNPRNLVQSLILAGRTQPQITNLLERSPFVKGLYAGKGLPAPSEPGFQFIPGIKLPVQQTLEQLRTNSAQIPLIQGLMSYGGLDPVSEFAKFFEALPKANV